MVISFRMIINTKTPSNEAICPSQVIIINVVGVCFYHFLDQKLSSDAVVSSFKHSFPASLHFASCRLKPLTRIYEENRVMKWHVNGSHCGRKMVCWLKQCRNQLFANEFNVCETEWEDREQKRAFRIQNLCIVKSCVPIYQLSTISVFILLRKGSGK